MSARQIPPAGELRQSQVLTTYGPGAMVDLPNHSVLIGGLETWEGDKEPVHEGRLLDKLRRRLGVDELKLFKPPVDSNDAFGRRTGITAFQFPTWFLGQVEETFVDSQGRAYRTRPLVPWARLTKGRYLDRFRKLKAVVPVRFVQACPKGHLSDIDWYAFVRRDFDTDRVGQLWLDEGGSGNDFAEIFVRCEKTGLRRPLSDARLPQSKVLGRCNGRQPWLGPRVWSACDQHNRLLIRSASNAWFSHTMSVIHIPDSDARLREAVDRVYEDFLQYCEDARDVRRERKKQKVFNALEGFTDDEVWAEVERREGPVTSETKGIKQAEFETLDASAAVIGEDRASSDFYAREHPLEGLPTTLASRLSRLRLVHRLKLVTAQVGFTRFEAALPDVDGELDIDIELAPLARELSWLPAVENRGEGVFIAFSEASVEAWLRRPAVRARGLQLEAGFEAWKRRKGLEDKPYFPGLPYVMLHSLSHLLITAVSLDCGYSASAIQERIYAGPYGYGILLLTGSPGSEGTLGGLVDVGRDLGRHLTQALELGRLCSNDPVCAQHSPDDPHEERFLHGAACHGCLLIAETCCERRNELLDRALVVPTVDTPGAAFFPEAG